MFKKNFNKEEFKQNRKSLKKKARRLNKSGIHFGWNGVRVKSKMDVKSQIQN